MRCVTIWVFFSCLSELNLGLCLFPPALSNELDYRYQNEMAVNTTPVRNTVATDPFVVCGPFGRCNYRDWDDDQTKCFDFQESTLSRTWCIVVEMLLSPQQIYIKLSGWVEIMFASVVDLRWMWIFFWSVDWSDGAHVKFDRLFDPRVTGLSSDIHHLWVSGDGVLIALSQTAHKFNGNYSWTVNVGFQL